MREAITDQQVLRKISEPVTPDDKLEFLNDLLYYPGAIGMSAIQFGIPKRVFTIGRQVFINPQVLSESKLTEVGDEGCMSLPGVIRPVRRPIMVTAQWENLQRKKMKGMLHGLKARCFQHELDHLNGKLIIDYPRET